MSKPITTNEALAKACAVMAATNVIQPFVLLAVVARLREVELVRFEIEGSLSADEEELLEWESRLRGVRAP